jgi:hypothetical protein
MKTKIILLLCISSYLKLSAQSEPRPIGNFNTLAVCNQVYFNKNTPSDAMIGLPRVGVYYEFGVDLFQHRHWSIFGDFRWGRVADGDEAAMRHYLENKYPDDFVIAPRQNTYRPKMRQYLLGVRYKMGNKRLQFQPGLAFGITKAKIYAFDAAIKTPNSNALLRTEAAFKGANYKKNYRFTWQLSEDLFYRISKKEVWLQLTGALLMVNFPYDTIEFKTQNELTQDSSMETLKASRFKLCGSFSLGLVFLIWE